MLIWASLFLDLRKPRSIERRRIATGVVTWSWVWAARTVIANHRRVVDAVHGTRRVRIRPHGEADHAIAAARKRSQV